MAKVEVITQQMVKRWKMGLLSLIGCNATMINTGYRGAYMCFLVSIPLDEWKNIRLGEIQRNDFNLRSNMISEDGQSMLLYFQMKLPDKYILDDNVMFNWSWKYHDILKKYVGYKGIYDSPDGYKVLALSNIPGDPGIANSDFKYDAVNLFVTMQLWGIDPRKIMSGKHMYVSDFGTLQEEDCFSYGYFEGSDGAAYLIL